MPIDYSKLRNIAARDLIKALDRDGFSHTRTGGSHRGIDILTVEE
jgi:predicted RNA binding protein YcfA (HicA-like mRNA interferase family)